MARRQQLNRQQLSAAQREAIRAVADQDKRPLGKTGVQHRTLESLRKLRLVRMVMERGLPVGWELTATGRDAHEQIMASGDGPERLKAMLSFGGRR